MNTRILKIVGVALVMAMATGCATKGDLDALRAEMQAQGQASQSSADQARAAAAEAQRTGSRAQQSAAEAQTAAARAQATADQASIAASDANKCCQANTERMDRMFQKSQQK